MSAHAARQIDLFGDDVRVRDADEAHGVRPGRAACEEALPGLGRVSPVRPCTEPARELPSPPFPPARRPDLAVLQVGPAVRARAQQLATAPLVIERDEAGADDRPARAWLAALSLLSVDAPMPAVADGRWPGTGMNPEAILAMRKRRDELAAALGAGAASRLVERFYDGTEPRLVLEYARAEGGEPELTVGAIRWTDVRFVLVLIDGGWRYHAMRFGPGAFTGFVHRTDRTR